MSEALFGFLGVIVGAFITIFKESVAAWLARRRNAEYLAIRVVSMLDEFVDGCAGVAGDNGYHDGHHVGVATIQVPTPIFDVHDLDADWKSIPSKLMYETLSFPSLINASNQRIDGAFEYTATPPDYDEGFEARQFEYSKLGLRAARLAEQYRSSYGIPPKEVGRWNPVDYLAQTQDGILDQRARRAEQHTKLQQALKANNEGA
ncbi:hypothetical protein [Sedimenticola sp.]|uniref:hypothetical protein n=1 Tax=Sedimenticola sp. TaxID=1940285 RepID=UPI003D0D7005